VTEPTIQSEEPVQRPAGGGLAAAIAPEGVAAVVAIALVAALLTVRLAGLGSTGLVPTPRPTDQASPGATSSPPAVDLIAINTVLGVDQRLLDYGRLLQAEIDKTKVSTDRVKQTMGQMSQQIILAGAPAAARLRDAPATALVGTDLGTVYAELLTELAAANDFKRSDEPGWRAAAVGVVETLTALPPIDLRLETMRAGLPDPAGPVVPTVAPTTAPTATPVPSASTAPTPPPTAPPTAPPTPAPTVPPSFAPTPSSTPPLAEPNQLQNPGFEVTTDPWQLVRTNPNVNGTLALDPTSPHGGKTSARIDISTFDGVPQSLVLQQRGVTLDQGARYRVSIALRATFDRLVRIRVTSSSPPAQTYATQPLPVGTAWTVQTFEFNTAVGGTDRLFTIEVGQAGGSVWVDDVSIARVSPFAP
jgi:hypothetical protein